MPGASHAGERDRSRNPGGAIVRGPQRIGWIGCILVTALLVGFGLASAQPEPVCLFFDDFDDEEGGWESSVSRWRGKGYRSGEYAFWEYWHEKYQLAWAPYDGLFPDEFSAVAVGYKYAGADDAEYGIVWGHDDRSFCCFRVAPDGWYRVSEKQDGEWQSSPVPWTQSADIAAETTLRVTVKEGTATLFIDEKEQGSFALSTSGPWKIGLYTASQATPRIEIRFASLGVYEPDTE
jgi:hypothetical protein